MRSKIVDVQDSISLIHSGNTIAITGNCEMLLPDLILKALEEKYLSKGNPRNMTIIYPVIPGAHREGTGVDRFAHPGMIKRVLAGSYSVLKVRKLCDLINSNSIEAYYMPMGASWQLFRAIAGGRPGIITQVGVGSFIDPRNGEGKINLRTKEDLVTIIKIEGKEYLFYKSFPIDVAIIRGTTADEQGNISIEEEPLPSGMLDIAMASKNSGGVVIAQVKRITQVGHIHPKRVEVPGIFVDKVVVDPSQQDYFPYNPYYTGDLRMPTSQFKPLPLNWQKVIVRRAAFELRKGQNINLGFGIAAGVPSVAFEEGIAEEVCFGVEHGHIGGIPATKDAFGAGINSLAIMDSPDIFNMYDAGGLDIAFLGMAQIDQEGNINVSSFDGKYNLGGFLDIVWKTPKIVFCGSFKAGGFEAIIQDKKLKIIKEGQIKKLIKNVTQKTLDVKRAIKEGQSILYITERAVFDLTEKGLRLKEIAPGVELNRDIIEQMEFEPIISKNLLRMDNSLFIEDKIGLKEKFSK